MEELAEYGVKEQVVTPIENARFYMHSVEYQRNKLICLLDKEQLKELVGKINQYLEDTNE